MTPVVELALGALHRLLVCGAALLVPATARAEWLREWQNRLEVDSQTPAERVATMRAANPTFIPRNHRVQAALDAADLGDYQPFHKLLDILQRPYDAQPAFTEYTQPPQPSERVLQTFCGT